MIFYQDIIIEPVVSEKCYDQIRDQKVYQFKVHKDATKPQIKEAIEKLFNVRVLDVRTINVHPKMKRRGLIRGFTSSWKKAYVSIHKDDTIEFFEGVA